MQLVIFKISMQVLNMDYKQELLTVCTYTLMKLPKKVVMCTEKFCIFALKNVFTVNNLVN